MENNIHLLVVDDDEEIRNLLVKLLEDYSYQVSSAKDGIELFQVLDKHEVDLIILDLMLPGDDGLTLCRKLRSSTQTPIIMLTAAGDDTDRIVGLELGADDYMAKPFNPRELVARIKAVLRRAPSAQTNAQNIGMTTQKCDAVEFSNWILDLQLRKLISRDNVEIELSTGEFILLQAFVKSPQQVLSRDKLLDITQHRPAGPFDRSIDVQVSRLRQKIETNPKKPSLIKTVRGGGYLFTAKIKQIVDFHA